MVDADDRLGRLERRVIVSCPMRDPAVGRTIAELVARGHDLTSESATLRNAEGRVDTSRADPLNLLMGRPRSRIHDAASRILDVVLALLLVVGLPLAGDFFRIAIDDPDRFNDASTWAELGGSFILFVIGYELIIGAS